MLLLPKMLVLDCTGRDWPKRPPGVLLVLLVLLLLFVLKVEEPKPPALAPKPVVLEELKGLGDVCPKPHIVCSMSRYDLMNEGDEITKDKEMNSVASAERGLEKYI